MNGAGEAFQFPVLNTIFCFIFTWRWCNLAVFAPLSPFLSLSLFPQLIPLCCHSVTGFQVNAHASKNVIVAWLWKGKFIEVHKKVTLRSKTNSDSFADKLLPVHMRTLCDSHMHRSRHIYTFIVLTKVTFKGSVGEGGRDLDHATGHLWTHNCELDSGGVHSRNFTGVGPVHLLLANVTARQCFTDITLKDVFNT